MRAATRRRIGQDVLLFAAETVLGLLSYLVVLPPIGAPAFWLSNGLGIAVLVRSPRPAWRHLLPTIAAANAVVFAVQGTPVPAILLWTLGDLVEVLAAALLVRRFSGRAVTLDRLRHRAMK